MEESEEITKEVTEEITEDVTEEVTEILVVAELTGVIDHDFLMSGLHQAKIFGIDTDNPVLQIDNSIFSGKFEDMKGTAVIFEETKADGGEPELKYLCKTFKKLVLERVFLQERAAPKPASSGDESVHDTIDGQSHTASSTSNSETVNYQPSFTVSSAKEENMCLASSSTEITDNSVKNPSFPVSSVEEEKSMHEGKCVTTLPSSDSNSTLASCNLGEIGVTESKVLEEKENINFTIPVDKPSISSETFISVLKSADSEKSTTSDVEMTEFVEKLNTCSIKGSEGGESQILEMQIERPSTAACSKPATQHISPPVQSSQSQATSAKNSSETET